MCTVRRVSVATYFVLIGYRHRSETRSCISEALSIETNQTGLETNISVSVFVSGVWSQSRTPDHTLGVRTARSQGLNLVDCYNAKRWLRSGQQKQRKKSLLPSKIDITSAIDANEDEHTNRRYTVVVFCFGDEIYDDMQYATIKLISMPVSFLWKIVTKRLRRHLFIFTRNVYF